jgi:hypothetical protein
MYAPFGVQECIGLSVTFDHLPDRCLCSTITTTSLTLNEGLVGVILRESQTQSHSASDDAETNLDRNLDVH